MLKRNLPTLHRNLQQTRISPFQAVKTPPQSGPPAPPDHDSQVLTLLASLTEIPASGA